MVKLTPQDVGTVLSPLLEKAKGPYAPVDLEMCMTVASNTDILVSPRLQFTLKTKVKRRSSQKITENRL